MSKSHKKLKVIDRETIFGYLKQGHSVRGIAQLMNRSPSTISRELRRDKMSFKTYKISEAQVDRNKKASLKGRIPKLVKGKQPLKTVHDWIFINRWSPEQISAKLKIKYKNQPKKQVSHETIYKYIYNLEDEEERKKYIGFLRQKRKKRRSRKKLNKARGPVPNIVSIHSRPSEVEDRLIPGHWEGDSIVGKDHQSAIGTLVERKYRYTIIIDYKGDKSSSSVALAFAEAFKSIPEEYRKTLTFDRGAEMAQHEYFTELTGIPVYFADPGSPGQRGTNENTNGLIREFFPKKTNFNNVASQELKAVEALLNNRPRKSLDFNSPVEKWFEGLGKPPPSNQTPIPERRGEQR